MAEETAASFDDELLREVAPGHPLHERRCVAIAKREATDDVLFAVGADEVAVVHLTWHRSRSRHHGPRPRSIPRSMISSVPLRRTSATERDRCRVKAVAVVG